MKSDPQASFDILSLPRSLKRESALESLLGADTMTGENAELCISAGSVASIDVVAATASRMRIARHLRLHPNGRVALWLPKTALVAAKYLDMLDPVPERVTTDRTLSTRAPAHYTLLPATPIADSESARLAGAFVFDSCRKAAISRRRAGYISAMVMELADNAHRHAVDALDPAIVAVNSFGRERLVEVAVTDCGSAISEAEDPVALLRVLPGRAISGDPGFLSHILRRGREAGVDVTVEIMAGTARLRWTTTNHSTVRRRYVPGTTVVARVSA